MAKFNEILVGRYNRLLQKLFQVKGTAPVPILSTEIQAQIQLFSGEENRYLEGWKLCGVGLFQAAVAAQTAAIQLRNPTTSNIIAVIEVMDGGSGTAGELDISTAALATDLATLQGAFVLDQRAETGGGGPGLIASIATGVGLGALGKVFDRFTVLASGESSQFLRSEIVLVPGTALRINHTIANAGLFASFRWRERFLEESERT